MQKVTQGKYSKQNQMINEDLGHQKKQLEIDKLQEELKILKHPLYCRLSFYAALAPIVVSIVAIVFSISNGLFETNSKLLEIRKGVLQLEINKFESQKDSLRIKNKQFADSIKLETKKVRKELTSIKTKYSKLNNDKKLLLGKISTLEIELNKSPIDKNKTQKLIDEISVILERNLGGSFNNDFDDSFDIGK
jgi:hypothetical protein